MLEDVVANVEEWKRDTATKQDIAILSLKIDELKAAQLMENFQWFTESNM